MEDIKKAINAYIDQMPKYSRVNFPELVLAVREDHGPNWNTSIVDAAAHEVVRSRDDLRVERGRGIVKYSRV